MKRNIHLVLLLFTTLILSSCSNIYSNKMYILINNQYSVDSCSINFKDIISEPWDNIYIISEMISPSNISNTIGSKYEGKTVPDGEKKILIIKNKHIIVEDSFYDDRFSFKSDSLSRKGFVKISYLDTFCVTLNTSIPSAFYFLQKK